MGGEVLPGDIANLPFEAIVKRGVLVGELGERRKALTERCRSRSGLTLQEVVGHNDWLLQVEKDLSQARARIERDFRISNALSLKAREGGRKAQLQQRLDALRAQCDALNECIHGLSDHCAWFQESGTYREALGYLERRGDDDGSCPAGLATLDDARLELCPGGASPACGGSTGDPDGSHNELEGLIHSSDSAASVHEKRRRRRKHRRKEPKARTEESERRREESAADEDRSQEEGREAGRDDRNLPVDWSEFFAPDFRWLRGAGRNGGASRCVDVWAPD